MAARRIGDDGLGSRCIFPGNCPCLVQRRLVLSVKEQIVETLAWWIVCGIPVVAFLAYASIEWFAVAAWTGIALAAATFVLLEAGTCLAPTFIPGMSVGTFRL